MYFVGRARGYGVYGIIRDLIEEGSAKFVNNSGRYLVNWVKALEYHEAYKRKKNPDFNSRDQSRQKLSNDLRSALLSSSYKKDGAKEYSNLRICNDDNEVVERRFQMPRKVFKSLFGNAELSDSSEEQDEQGAVGAQAFAGSSSDTGFEEAMDLTFEMMKLHERGTQEELGKLEDLNSQYCPGSIYPSSHGQTSSLPSAMSSMQKTMLWSIGVEGSFWIGY
ncbi:uncharacterized protein LOC122951079 [Acropora millepora]|uniref:uncharacterized protein LOC122951079 n=1 Tax=Acropora millepora TaxID=45264 RepID=UPI001CF30FA5|nr:uncharacterized protein LOC122951079 [Acropora millepora]